MLPKHLLLLTLLALPRPAAGQAGAEPMRLTRLTGPVELDGRLEEPAWAGVPALPLVMYTPTFRAPLTERTEIMVAYDDRYIYLGARLYDSEPRKVRANTLYRDRYSGDDLVALVLDTYNDRQSASWFTVNPAGNRIDRALSNDGEFSNGDPMNDNWNTVWDVATTQTDSGWFAEMRIPFSSLGFQDVNGTVTMGLIAYRVIARKNERQLFPAIPPNWDLGFAKVSRAQPVVLEGVRSRRPVYVTPYALGGFSWRSE
ncbi:MAG TPA: carbohydrate binding family 9 domain-containing protein, partial [Gemmatimonadales bacterium]|nr:carbohydrate binding family 9 domain-containing protein [Gemmatimonadales bacterium]